MRDYVLVSDSTADMNVEVVKKLDVKIIPFSYSVNDNVYHYYLDERDGDINEFYANMKKGAMPVTSQVNPITYKEYFEEIVSEGKDILYICFTSGLSGSYQTALMGVNMLKDKYPDANIVVIDSLCASIGQGLLMYLAAKKKQEGMSMDELEQWILTYRKKIRHWFMVEDLFHLKRGGRVTTVEAVVGSALKIKPILSVDDEGKLFVKSKTRGVSKALDYIIERFKAEAADPETQTVVIGHADAMEKAERLKKMVMEAGVLEENIILAPIGPIIGTHVGAGMAALVFVEK